MPSKGRISILPFVQLETGKRRVVPHSVGGPLWFLMRLFICVWTWPRYRATHWTAVLATALRCVEGYRTPDAALVC